MPILSDNPDVVPAQPETLVPARPPVAFPVVWIVRLLVEQYDPNGPIVATVWYKKARDVLDARGGHVRYLLARAHLRFAHAHSAHHVHAAVHLGRCADREYALPADESARLRAGLDRAGPAFVAAELERLFLRREGTVDEAMGLPDAGGLPDARELAAYDAAYLMWRAPGLAALRRGDDGAVEDWLDRLAALARAYQRRSGEKQVQDTSGRVRRFVHAFRYECLARFHGCLADLWTVLIPRLERFCDLDRRGARFLSAMHQVHRPDDGGRARGGGRGALCGYPLALHPVGRWVLGQPRHLAALAAWVDDPAHDAHVAAGTAWACPAYRRWLHAILCAATEYAAARRHDDATARPVRVAARAAARQASLATRPVGQDVSRLLPASSGLDGGDREALAAAFGRVAEAKDLACGECPDRPRLPYHAVTVPSHRRRPASSVRVTYACPQCGARQRLSVRPADLAAALRAADGQCQDEAA